MAANVPLCNVGTDCHSRAVVKVYAPYSSRRDGTADHPCFSPEPCPHPAMQFDDRLATVLRQKAGASAGARTQYRQLLDLLGRPQPGRDPSLLAAARLRLDSLADVISVRERAEIVREQGRRLNDPALVAHFAEAEPDIASATLSTARLTEAQWLALIPELPVRARGFLRLRRDLPEKVDALLERLGVHDRALPLPPEPEPLVEQPGVETESRPEPTLAGDNREHDDEDIVDGEYTEVDDDESVEPEPQDGTMSAGDVATAAGAVAAGVSGADANDDVSPS